MSTLKTKSDLSLAAAEFLDANSHYSSVIHCAYYSCFQRMKHTWLVVMCRSEQDLSSSKRSHEFLINQIKNHIRSRSADDNAFNRKISDLKRLRLNADYGNNVINRDTSKKSIRLSKAILQILENCA